MKFYKHQTQKLYEEEISKKMKNGKSTAIRFYSNQSQNVSILAYFKVQK